MRAPNQDEELNRFATEIKDRLCNFSAHDLKKNEILRVATATDAAQILSQMDAVLRGREQLGLFEAEIRSILEGQRPSLVHVLYFDTEVHKAEVYQAGQPIALTPVGGGGTNFAPCFRWLDERGIVPQTLVFLTDLCGAFPKEAPAYPVLWASTESRRAPFGQVIPMEAA
jgi:predicted metal-dependent peptidase